MEVVIFIIGTAIFFTIYLCIESIKEKNVEKQEKEREYNKLKQENPIKNQEIIELKKDNEVLKSKITELENINNSIMHDKEIIRVFEVMNENNDPRTTKEKLAKLWDILPYYPPDWEIRKWVVRKREDYKCYHCGLDLRYPTGTDTWGEVHHIVPLIMNGTNEINNLIFVCHKCHEKLHKEAYNFNFSKFGYEPLFNWKCYSFNSRKLSTSNSEREKLDEILRPASYDENEPDTDKYYNISRWEDELE